MIPDIGDVIELVRDIPERNIRAGMQGTVVHSHGNDVYEVEFTNADGNTLDFFCNISLLSGGRKQGIGFR